MARANVAFADDANIQEARRPATRSTLMRMPSHRAGMAALPGWIGRSRFVVVLLVLLAGTGCGGSSKPTSERVRPVIPGGAAVEAQAGAPKVCSQLAASKEMRRIGSVLDGWAQDPPAPGAAARLHDAGVALQRLAEKADVRLAPTLRSTGRTMERVGRHAATPQAASSLANALRRLGRKLEGPCGYPLG